MDTSKPMTLLLLEDDKITTNEFEKRNREKIRKNKKSKKHDKC